MKFKIGDELIAVYGENRIKKGDVGFITLIEPCDNYDDDTHCRECIQCGGTIKGLKMKKDFKTYLPSCYGYYTGYLWALNKITSWKDKIEGDEQ